MADRLIEADKAKEVLTKLLYETALNNSGGASLMCEDIAENRLETWLELVPTVDAVPVVRCKDCTHNDIDDWCPFFMAGFIREPNGYCSWGERREDGNKPKSI